MYTYSEACPANAAGLGFTCLPQLWGTRNLAAFQQASQNISPPVFLTFNEPDSAAQANLAVPSAISLWNRALAPLAAKGEKLCSPATTWNPSGLQWLQSFINECPQCTFDYVCVHWYGTALQDFQNYVNTWHLTFNKPILVTEFGLENFNGGSQPSASDFTSFYEAAIPWLNEQTFVLAYFPFGWQPQSTSNGRLLNTDGSLNALGSLVLSTAGA